MMTPSQADWLRALARRAAAPPRRDFIAATSQTRNAPFSMPWLPRRLYSRRPALGPKAKRDGAPRLDGPPPPEFGPKARVWRGL